VPVRHGRMMLSPFTFYRGAAKIMATDLRDTPRAGLNMQLCGDAHLSNFRGCPRSACGGGPQALLGMRTHHESVAMTPRNLSAFSPSPSVASRTTSTSPGATHDRRDRSTWPQSSSYQFGIWR